MSFVGSRLLIDIRPNFFGFGSLYPPEVFPTEQAELRACRIGLATGFARAVDRSHLPASAGRSEKEDRPGLRNC